MTQSWCNPLANSPLVSRADSQQAVIDLYEPLIPFLSEHRAQAHLASFGAVFEARVAGLEGFARPLYGIVPLTVGGAEFPYWDNIVAGLDAGTDPASSDYWGPVAADVDQRMVEQAAIGLAMAFCPEQIWGPLSDGAKQRVVDWLSGIYVFEPAGNNWQFFRVLVSLGLERVGMPFDQAKTDASLALIQSFERGDYWYVDGSLNTVDYYTPFALHTYGLMYAAANDLGLGDDAIAAHFRQRARGFAADFVHWFDGTGGAIAMGRSLTYRFAMASFWGALAWADVEPAMGWGAARGMLMRHLRWWQDKAISDRDGVLSVGFAYDNRRLCESYNSGCSPYWAMKAFGALGAPADHPFWTTSETSQPVAVEPVDLVDAGWVVTRDETAALALVAQPALDLSFPEQGDAKYRKFAYSSVFGLCGDIVDARGGIWTDAMLALTDEHGMRKVRRGIVAAGVKDHLVWSTWYPWNDVRIDTVCWAVSPQLHGRMHRIRTGRSLLADESGFALPYEPTGMRRARPSDEDCDGRAEFAGEGATSSVWQLDPTSVTRTGAIRETATNSNLMHPHTAVPLLRSTLPPGDHVLAAGFYAATADSGPATNNDEFVSVPATVIDLVAEIAATPHEAFNG